MTKIRKTYSKQIKFKAALDLIKSEKTIAELCHEYGVHKSVLCRWKKTLLDEGAKLFEDQRQKEQPLLTKQTDALERKIGQLYMEVDFLKKALGQ